MNSLLRVLHLEDDVRDTELLRATLEAEGIQAELTRVETGQDFLAAVKAQEKLGPEATVVTIFCDDNKKYLSTALMNEEAPRPEYLSPRIELLGIGTVGRACEFCH